LLDLGLPEASGSASYTLLRKIAPGVPVVVLTADATEETQVSVIISGVHDYLVKQQMSGPLLIEALRSAIYANKGRKSNKTAQRHPLEK
jgi:sigma-B regulation protein RsbU (phosphoserine phosphatase)